MPVAMLSPASQSYVASTVAQTGPDIVNTSGCRGVVVVLDTTVIGTGNITLVIEGKDEASGKYYLLLSGAAVTTNTTNRYKVHPRITAVGNVSAQDCLPRVWRWRVTVGNSNPATYTIGAVTVL